MRHMKLGLFFAPAGHHLAAWRHPRAYSTGFGISSYVSVAQAAERACLDMVFVADVFALTPDGPQRDTLRLEPITLLSALAMVTSRIGLIGTATTTYNEPYNVARQFASLDQICQGRAGWNIVTSSSSLEAKHFGFDAHPESKKRYEIAREFVEVVRGLWDSWEDGGILIDKASGLFFDPEKLHILKHSGDHFCVQGPLSIPRSPQGQPVLVQAGSSEDGKNLAAAVAEIIFTIQREIEGAKTFYKDVKERIVARGREPEHALILPGVMPVIGRTRMEAQDNYEKLQNLIHPRAGLQALSSLLDMDLADVDIDGPLPEVDVSKLTQSRAIGIVDVAVRDNLTVREVYERLVVSKGHWQLVGTPVEIADTLQEWFDTGAADGFNVMPAQTDCDFAAFLEGVVPELQRRGLFRTSYEGRVLREHLGLPIPHLAHS
jgi:FMN-dependent oxidoreductase (nitrilotriacetate monooxygenase family)